MDKAYRFMDSILDYPVAECGEPLLSLPEIVEERGLNVRFSETKIAGKHSRIFYLREGLIDNFAALSRKISARGWILKVEDGYRTTEMQRDLALQSNVFNTILKKVLWETDGKDPDPALINRRLTVLIATSPKIGTHMSGSAMDISVLKTDDLSEIERGGPYLELSEKTPMSSPFVSETAVENRAEITALMRSHGFIAYPYEFWHYSKDDAYTEYLAKTGKAAKYGAVNLNYADGSTSPVPDPAEPLHSPEDIDRYIRSALTRLRK